MSAAQRVRPSIVAGLVGLLSFVSAGPAQAQFGGVPFGGGGQTPVTVSASVVPHSGETGLALQIQAKLASGKYTYAMSQPTDAGPFPVSFTIAESPDYELLGEWTADQQPEIAPEPLFDNAEVHKLKGTVTWTWPIRLTSEVDPASVIVKGRAKMLVCDKESCVPFPRLSLEAKLTSAAIAALSGEPAPEPEPEATQEGEPVGSSTEEAAPVAEVPPVKEPTVKSTPAAAVVGGAELFGYLMAAALGGFLLNFMPCVLPVVGLKIMSFVTQAGQSRGRVFLLNLYYTIGVMFVFLVLATLAVLPAFLGMLASTGLIPAEWVPASGLGWGQQFQSQAFVITLACLVWVMAPSFLGVWEIPVPGFAVTGGASELASREGFTGAFGKGVLATLLATPCTAPSIGAVLGFALTQPAWVVYAIFGAMGLGFAMPYLVIGLFPALIRFLPRPGEWMNTFKHVMGFFLLGTVAYLLFTIRDDGAALSAAFSLLMAFWFACWYVGRLEAGASTLQTLHAWLVGAAVVAMVGFFVFGYLRFQAPLTVLALGLIPPLVWIGWRPSPGHKSAGGYDWQPTFRRWAIGLAGAGAVVAVVLGIYNRPIHFDWIPYSPERVAQLSQEGKTVFVEFTADWCASCQFKEEFSVHTERVKWAVDSGDIVMVKADFTNFSSEIQETINSFGLEGIPLSAIYPAGKPNEPIVLPNIFTESQLLEMLDEAGPSKTTKDVTTVAGGERGGTY